MIRTVEISQERWPSFVETINKLADGRPVRLEVAHRELGDQEMEELLPLVDFDFETKGSEKGRVMIAVSSGNGELNHLIEEPLRIAVGLNEGGAVEWIAIDEPGEATTIVHIPNLPALEESYGAEA
jgi:hypothetical protein